MPWSTIHDSSSVDAVYINITRQGGTGSTAMNISYGVHKDTAASTFTSLVGATTNILWGATNRPAYSASNNRDYGTDVSALGPYLKAGGLGLTFGHTSEAASQGNYAVINNNVEMNIYYTRNPYA
jgi:hypothetical protein